MNRPTITTSANAPMMYQTNVNCWSRKKRCVPPRMNVAADSSVITTPVMKMPQSVANQSAVESRLSLAPKPTNMRRSAPAP